LADSKATSGSSLFSRLELVAKIALGAAAIAYGIGVYLVSSDLAQYKVSNFSLARPQYIFTGAAWLFTTVVAIVPPFFAALLTKIGHFKWRNKVGNRIYFAVISIFGCAYFLAQAVEILMPSAETKSVMPYTTLAATVFFFVAWGNLPSRKELDPHEDTKEKVSLVPAGIGFGVVALLIWTAAYNIDVFPNVEPSLGGGKHPTARVVFCEPEKDKEGQLKKLLGSTPELDSFTTDATRSPLTVLLVDADFVVIVFEDCKKENEERKAQEQETGVGTQPFSKVFPRVLWRTLTGRNRPIKEYKTVLVKKSLVASIQYD
jgi:hypothetical protein